MFSLIHQIIGICCVVFEELCNFLDLATEIVMLSSGWKAESIWFCFERRGNKHDLEEIRFSIRKCSETCQNARKNLARRPKMSYSTRNRQKVQKKTLKLLYFTNNSKKRCHICSENPWNYFVFCSNSTRFHSFSILLEVTKRLVCW